MWFSLHHFPIPQYFLHQSKKLLAAIVISSHMEEKQSMYRLKSSKIIDCCLKHNIMQFHGFFMHRHFFSNNTLALRVENTK